MLKPGSVFFITGAASGIGAATAELATSLGHRVAACDLNLEAASALARRLGENTLPIPLEVRESESWERALDAAWAWSGGVDVLVNNAGVIHTGWVREQPFGDLQHMVDAATKHAVRAFHHGYAMEERDSRIAYTLVCPGVVDTPMLHQQVGIDASAISFSVPAMKAGRIAAAVLRAAEKRPLEILIPAFEGERLRLAGIFPRLVRWMAPVAEKKGRRAMAGHPGRSRD
jgi:NADP-dependent 3-hydroxy acid dehydrogenase YdfG